MFTYVPFQQNIFHLIPSHPHLSFLGSLYPQPYKPPSSSCYVVVCYSCSLYAVHPDSLIPFPSASQSTLYLPTFYPYIPLSFSVCNLLLLPFVLILFSSCIPTTTPSRAASVLFLSGFSVHISRRATPCFLCFHLLGSCLSSLLPPASALLSFVCFTLLF